MDELWLELDITYFQGFYSKVSLAEFKMKKHLPEYIIRGGTLCVNNSWTLSPI